MRCLPEEMPDVDEDTRRNISAIRMLVSLTRVKTGWDSTKLVMPPWPSEIVVRQRIPDSIRRVHEMT